MKPEEKKKNNNLTLCCLVVAWSRRREKIDRGNLSAEEADLLRSKTGGGVDGGGNITTTLYVNVRCGKAKLLLLLPG